MATLWVREGGCPASDMRMCAWSADAHSRCAGTCGAPCADAAAIHELALSWLWPLWAPAPMRLQLCFQQVIGGATALPCRAVAALQPITWTSRPAPACACHGLPTTAYGAGAAPQASACAVEAALKRHTLRNKLQCDMATHPCTPHALILLQCLLPLRMPGTTSLSSAECRCSAMGGGWLHFSHDVLAVVSCNIRDASLNNLAEMQGLEGPLEQRCA